MHLFLSPHLDDAALSCGGLIHQLSRAGHQVQVRTYLAGDPPSPPPDTPLIQDLHQRWGEHPKGVMAARRQEDRAAMAQLGGVGPILCEHLPYLDCPYRTDSQGRPLYPQNNDLFGPIHPQDPLLSLSLDLPPGLQALYVPLGAGGHVDHLIIRRLAAQAPAIPVFFYEEYPYSAASGEGARISQGAAGQLVGQTAISAAQASLNLPLQPALMTLAGEDLEAKIAAIAAYQSQISTFWDTLEDMAQRVRAYAQQVAPSLAHGAERLWKIQGE